MYENLNKNLLRIFILLIFLILGYLLLILFIILKNVNIPIAYIFKMFVKLNLQIKKYKNICYLENEIKQIKDDNILLNLQKY